MIDSIHPLETFTEARKGKPGCLFCDPFKGMSVFETENFRILIDTFPVTAGHLMISSKEHFGSAGEVPEHLQGELSALKNMLNEQVRSINGDSVFYEHGRAGCCLASNPDGSKCEHFHLHCLPVSIDITTKLNQTFEAIKMKRFSEISPLFYEEGNYLYFEDTLGNMFFYPAEDEKVESHLLRTLICNELRSHELSDWENCTDPDLSLKSYELVRNLHFENLELIHDLL